MSDKSAPDKIIWPKRGRPPKAVAQQVKRQKQEIVEKKADTVLTFQQTKKIDLFLEAFIKNGGNATQAAMDVFDCNSRATAAAVGHEYLQKAKATARIYLEQKGATYGKMLEIAFQKSQDNKSPDWWDRLMKIAGYEDFMTKQVKSGPGVVNIIQAQKEIVKQYVEADVLDGEEVDNGES